MCSRGVTNEESDKRKEHDEQNNSEKIKRKTYVLCAGQIVELTEYQDYQEGL